MPTSSHDVPPLTEYQSVPPSRFVPVSAMPGRSPSASEKLLSGPPASMSEETSVPTTPAGASASSKIDPNAGAAAVSSTGAALSTQRDSSG